jgi:hypothetical protein
MKKLTRAQVMNAIAKRVRLDGLRATARMVKIDAGYLSCCINGTKPFSDEAAAKFGYVRQEAQYIRRQSSK